MDNTTTNELSPPLLSINLAYFLTLVCKTNSTFDNVAILSLELGLKIKALDPNDEVSHVEFVGGLAHVFPIKDWQDSLKRRAKQQAYSEVQRQIKYALEQEQLHNRLLLQRRRDMLCEFTNDVRKMLAGKLHRFDPEFCEWMVFQALRGENPAAATKFGISAADIEEFSKLPTDPEWKNRYFKPHP